MKKMEGGQGYICYSGLLSFNQLLLPIITHHSALPALFAEVAYLHVCRMDFVCSKVLFAAEAAYENCVITHVRVFEIYSNLSGNQLGNHPYKPLQALFHLFEILFFSGAVSKILEPPHYNVYQHIILLYYYYPVEVDIGISVIVYHSTVHNTLQSYTIFLVKQITNVIQPLSGKIILGAVDCEYFVGIDIQ